MGDCKSCVFFKKRPEIYEGSGTCHRYPPVIGPRCETVFPAVDPDDGCGEHKAKIV